MRVHLLLPLGGTYLGGDPRGIVDLARRAEEAGVDGVVLAEHGVMGDDVDGYSWGSFPLDPSDPFPEPVVLMSAIAAVTERIMMSTGILIAALRPPALLAKQVATLDLLCSGRLELGVGTGWQRAELEAHGLSFEERGQLLTDTIAACRTLWAEQPATVRTDSFSFGPVWCHPGTVRPSGPPILFSGTLTARNVRRIVELGDGWIPIMGHDDRAVRDGIEVLRGELEAAGRSPGSLRVRVPLRLAKAGGKLALDATLGGIEDLERLGATDCTIPVAAFVRSAGDVDPFLAGVGAYRSLTR